MKEEFYFYILYPKYFDRFRDEDDQNIPSKKRRLEGISKWY